MFKKGQNFNLSLTPGRGTQTCLDLSPLAWVEVLEEEGLAPLPLPVAAAPPRPPLAALAAAVLVGGADIFPPAGGIVEGAAAAFFASSSFLVNSIHHFWSVKEIKTKTKSIF